ncbi:cytochrome P450 [Streptomyces sp. NPDC059894]|uniref:cytochrome P450 n=1 Tax=unclassified Streptomyces TaxID=2593676 RepID=UPI00364A9C4A
MVDTITFQQHWDRTDAFDPPALFDALREEQPAVRMTYPSGHLGWFVCNYELTRQVLADPRFSHDIEIGHFPVTKNGEPIPVWPAVPGMFIHMDPPDHTKYRRMLTGEFTTRRMNQLAPKIQEFATSQLELLKEQGPGADLVRHYVEPLVLRVITDLLGLSEEEYLKLAEYPDVIHNPEADIDWADRVATETFNMVPQFVARKRDEPGDDIITRLVQAGELNDEELTSILMLLFVAGTVTTEGALAVSSFALLHHTDQLERLRAEPALLDKGLEELLRYVTVNQYEIFRTALEDVQLGDVLVRKGETVTVSLPAANRDPSVFPDPAKLDLGRDAAGHVAFGHGIHQCIGQNLARVLLKAGLRTLFEGLPGLRLAVPSSDIPLRTKTSIFNVRELPVTW